MILVKENNRKIVKYQKKIFELESEIIGMLSLDTNKLEEFKKKFNKYKIICKLLYSNPDYYSLEKFIKVDNSLDRELVEFYENIWCNEHYEYIENIKNISHDIKILIKDSLKLGLISWIQYKAIKKLIQPVSNIFDKDIELKNFTQDYIPNQLNQISEVQLNLYFDIIEIILLKIHNFNKNLLNLKKSSSPDISILNILSTSSYLNTIKKIKINLENNISNL